MKRGREESKLEKSYKDYRNRQRIQAGTTKRLKQSEEKLAGLHRACAKKCLTYLRSMCSAGLLRDCIDEIKKFVVTDGGILGSPLQVVVRFSGWTIRRHNSKPLVLIIETTNKQKFAFIPGGRASVFIVKNGLPLQPEILGELKKRATFFRWLTILPFESYFKESRGEAIDIRRIRKTKKNKIKKLWS